MILLRFRHILEDSGILRQSRFRVCGIDSRLPNITRFDSCIGGVVEARDPYVLHVVW